MTRKDFIKNLATLGVAAPFLSTLLSACKKEDFFKDFEVNFNGKVLIIGAGAAGLMAGYIFQRQGIDFEIIEASNVFGGRVKKIEDFADFPIDLGAEWIHTDPSILAKLINDSKVDANIEIITYNPQTFSFWKNDKLRKGNIASNFYSEHKFKNSTWYDYFDQYIVPSISDKIVYNTPITEIDYSGNKVVATASDGHSYEADKILITVPLSILKADLIQFRPELPTDKVDVLESIDFPAGLKVFIEFSERFYPDITYMGGILSALTGSNGQKIFYDAAFGKESNRNILGLFTVGEPAEVYAQMTNNEEIISYILDELDEIFDGKASANYQKHVIQHWSKEPHIQGSYSHFQESFRPAIETLAAPIDNKVYFAGEAINQNGNTATVHGAAESAYLVLEKLLKG